MASVFEIDLENACQYAGQANVIRLGILMDRLEGDEALLSKAKNLLIAIENQDVSNIKKSAQCMIEYLKGNYGAEKFKILKALDELVNI